MGMSARLANMILGRKNSASHGDVASLGSLDAKSPLTPRRTKQDLKSAKIAWESGKNGPNCIKVSEEFHYLYDLGELVMPISTRSREVRYARRQADGKTVVVKIMWKSGCFHRTQDEMDWRQGTELLLNMPEHPGIARVYEVLEANDAFYIIQEHCTGLDLYEYRNQSGQVTTAVVREIMQQLLQALKHLHAHNLVHKDLKQENIMIDPKAFHVRRASAPNLTSLAMENGGQVCSAQAVKIIDFDNVCPIGHIPIDVLGTDQHISQEAYAGHFSPKSDVFAAGVIAYRLLAGKFPFPKDIFNDGPGENKVGSPKMQEIRGKVQQTKINWNVNSFRMFPLAEDLVQKMVTNNAEERFDASQCLNHAWFVSTL